MIPIGNANQRKEIISTRRLNENNNTLPGNIHIARDGEPVRILGAWLGNNIDQAVTWAPVMENCHKRLKRWGAAKHSLEGRRLILQMQVAGVTQYLTKVQGMPKNVKDDLNKLVRRFMWNYEKVDTVNQSQMSAPHNKGGKKMLDIEARNKAIHLMWLKAYLNLGADRPTWTFFADAIIGTDIPPSHRVDEDPESRLMPIIQSWETRTRGSTLPEDLKEMLKVAKEFKVRLEATNPSKQVKENLPLWYHAKSDPTARKLYKTKEAKCLRRKHHIKLVKDATDHLASVSDNHILAANCTCDTCKTHRSVNKCLNPNRCISLLAQLIKKITPRWNPMTTNMHNPTQLNDNQSQQEPGEIIFNKESETSELKDAIMIFGGPNQNQ